MDRRNPPHLFHPNTQTISPPVQPGYAPQLQTNPGIHTAGHQGNFHQQIIYQASTAPHSQVIQQEEGWRAGHGSPHHQPWSGHTQYQMPVIDLAQMLANPQMLEIYASDYERVRQNQVEEEPWMQRPTRQPNGSSQVASMFSPFPVCGDLSELPGYEL